jgi:signal transduction histidine kinase
LQAAQAAQHAVTRQLLSVQETERRHLARELHDEVMQTLTALQINLDLLAQGRPSAPITLRASTALVDDLMDQVRTLALDLRPTVLDELGLAAALEWYCQRQAPRLGLEAHYVGAPDLARPHSVIETTCFRVVQEAVTNVARHAHTGAVWIDLHARDDTLYLTIRDQGTGFDVEAVRRRAGQHVGIGLHGMEERLHLIGGRLDIRSAPGCGTTVHVWAPLHLPADGGESISRERK